MAVGPLLGARGACRTVLEKPGGQGTGERTEYGDDRRPYGHRVRGPLGRSVSVVRPADSKVRVGGFGGRAAPAAHVPARFQNPAARFSSLHLTVPAVAKSIPGKT
ncbi:hypothetical protein GCM10010260_70220 [Streptomyces filipinensis]|uniref:Uncharacterized protein n=1 Tax=Streptomyces filipinensis TaxID=66887 RepID=A0A918IHZ7_9ACTN|nr:hypothetical protein GCM10010260_70220 [Streptomyces filipinensis]